MLVENREVRKPLFTYMIDPTTFRRILLSAVLVPLLAMAALAGILSWQITSLLSAAQWIDHADSVIAEANAAQRFVIDQETGLRGYLVGQNPIYLTRYKRGQEDLQGAFAALDRLVADNPDQQQNLQAIHAQYAFWFKEAERERTTRSRPDYQADFNKAQGKVIMDELRSLFTKFIRAEEAVRAQRNERTQRNAQIVLFSVFGLSLTLGILLGILTYRRLTELGKVYGAALTTERKAREQAQGAQKEIAAKSEEILNLNADLEQRVLARTAELEATNRELESFSYSVSHDLRAPLRSIDGFSQALEEDYADAVDNLGKDYLHRIRANSKVMAELIDGLLQLSRLTRSEMQHETVNLSEMAKIVAEELQKQAPERDTQFVIADAVTAQGDPRLLRNVMENLLGNAWKFTSRREGAQIDFGVTVQEGTTVYYVRDNGAGFDMAYANKLFGAFQRLHGTKEFEGTGIGLATVQRIIRRHGGRIWADGAPQQGAVFYFTLEAAPPVKTPSLSQGEKVRSDPDAGG